LCRTRNGVKIEPDETLLGLKLSQTRSGREMGLKLSRTRHGRDMNEALLGLKSIRTRNGVKIEPDETWTRSY